MASIVKRGKTYSVVYYEGEGKSHEKQRLSMRKNKTPI